MKLQSGLIILFDMQPKIRIVPILILLVTMVSGQSSGLVVLMNPVQSEQGQDEEERWVRDYYHYRVSDIDQLDVIVNYNLGELNLEANHRKGMIDGSIRYYPSLTKPKIQYKTRGTTGILDITAKANEDDSHLTVSWDELKSFKVNTEQLKNELDFALPSNIPTDLDLKFGLGEAQINLTDLQLLGLNLDCGLSDVQLQINKPNDITSRYLEITNGLGSFKATGLGYLRTRHVNLKVGLGSAELDFRGQIQEDLEINIDVGLGSLELIFPKNVNVQANVKENFLSEVNINDLVKSGTTWTTPDWDESRPTVTLDVNVGLGSIDIDLRK